MSGASMAGGLAMKRRLANLKRTVPEQVEHALYLEAEIEVTEVKKRTPVDKGTLRGTVHQEGPTRNFRRIYTLIVAGGPAAPYALFVHEDLEAHHPVGEAKFIESVVTESRPFMAARVARRIDLNRAI